MIQLVIYQVYNVYMYALTVLPTVMIVLSGTTLGVLSTVLAMKLSGGMMKRMENGKLGLKKFVLTFVSFLIGLMLLMLGMMVAY